MRRALLIPVMLLAISLAGCAPGTRLGDLWKAATTTITNPANATTIYQIKNAYAATLQLVVDYREYCWARPYAVLMADPIAKPICQQRRAVVRAVQSARPKAAAAITVAENFVRDNSTLNAGTAITAAWRAVTDFQNLIPRTK